MRSIGIDIGTTTVSLAVLDTDREKLLHSVTLENDSHVHSTRSYERLQDPGKIASLAAGACEQAENDFGQAAAVGITGQMHGMLYLDNKGSPVSPLFSWQDERGSLPYRSGMTYAEYLTAMTGFPAATGFGLTTHFCNQVHRAVPRDARYLCTIGDYIAMRLAGNTSPVIHPTNAASLGFFSLEDGQFDLQALSAVGIDPSILPPVTHRLAAAGEASKGRVIAAAIGDNQAAFYGSISNPEEDLSVNIGTSSQISHYVREIPHIPDIDLRPAAEHGFLMVGAALCGGKAYAMAESFFRSVLDLAGCRHEGTLYAQMDAAALELGDAPDKLEVMTAFLGTRQDPSRRGSITGIGRENFTARRLCAGILEGIVNELREFYTRMVPGGTDQPFLRIVASGNALRKTPPLQRILSRKFSLPVHIPVHTEEAAFGSALYALKAAGIIQSDAEKNRFITYSACSS